MSGRGRGRGGGRGTAASKASTSSSRGTRGAGTRGRGSAFRGRGASAEAAPSSSKQAPLKPVAAQAAQPVSRPTAVRKLASRGRGGKFKAVASKPKIPDGGSVQSAIVIIPPEREWGQIQEIRSKHDKAFERWMPHINLLFPFVEERAFAKEQARLGKALANIAPFTVRLESLQEFDFGSSVVLSLRPEVVCHDKSQSGPFRSLLDVHAALIRALPAYANQHPGALGFRAHLTVGQFSPSDRELIDSIKQQWRPIEFRVEGLLMIARETSTPFAVRSGVRLGGVVDSQDIAGPLPLDAILNRISCSAGAWMHKLWMDPARRGHLPATTEALARAIDKFCSGKMALVSATDVLQTLLAREVVQQAVGQPLVYNLPEQTGESSRQQLKTASAGSSEPILSFEERYQLVVAWLSNPSFKAHPRSLEALKKSLKPLLVQAYRVDPNLVIDRLQRHGALEISSTGKINYV